MAHGHLPTPSAPGGFRAPLSVSGRNAPHLDTITATTREAVTVGEVRIIPAGQRSWLVPSYSRPELWHMVEKIGDGWACSCEAGQFGRPCRHVRLVQNAQVEDYARRADDAGPLDFHHDRPTLEDYFRLPNGNPY